MFTLFTHWCALSVFDTKSCWIVVSGKLGFSHQPTLGPSITQASIALNLLPKGERTLRAVGKFLMNNRRWTMVISPDTMSLCIDGLDAHSMSSHITTAKDNHFAMIIFLISDNNMCIHIFATCLPYSQLLAYSNNGNRLCARRCCTHTQHTQSTGT